MRKILALMLLGIFSADAALAAPRTGKTNPRITAQKSPTKKRVNQRDKIVSAQKLSAFLYQYFQNGGIEYLPDNWLEEYSRDILKIPQGFKNLSANDVKLIAKNLLDELAFRKTGKTYTIDPKFIRLVEKKEKEEGPTNYELDEGRPSPEDLKKRALDSVMSGNLCAQQAKLVDENLDSMSFEEVEKLYWDLDAYAGTQEYFGSRMEFSEEDKKILKDCCLKLQNAMKEKNNQPKSNGIGKDINIFADEKKSPFALRRESLVNEQAAIYLEESLKEISEKGFIEEVTPRAFMSWLLRHPEGYETDGIKFSAEDMEVVKKNMRAWMATQELSKANYTPDDDLIALGDRLVREGGPSVDSKGKNRKIDLLAKAEE